MSTENRIGFFLGKWILFVIRHAPWVLLFFIVLSAASLYFTWTHIGINTNTDDMLSKDLPYRQIRNDYFKSFPYHNDRILLVLDGSSATQLQLASRQLAAKLRQHSEMFNKVYVAGGNEYFVAHRLLYLDEAEFTRFSQDLTAATALLSRLQRHTSASQLLNAVAIMSQSQISQNNNITATIIKKTKQVLIAQQSDSSAVIDWNSIFINAQHPQNQSSKQTQHKAAQQLIILEPTKQYREVFAAAKAFSLIRHSARQLNITADYAMRLRITGSLAMSEAELHSVSKGMGFAGVMALSLVVLLLWFASRSFKILLFSLCTLLIGLSLTAGFAALAIGSLNLISVAFAVLYIGLGIDFPIHFCLRYQELLTQQKNHHDALRITTRDVGTSLVVCALSTAIGFYAFIPTDFVGLSELGIISGSGMFISLIVSLTVLPALFQLSPLKVTTLPRVSSQAAWLWFAGFLQRHRRLLLSAIVIVCSSALLLVPQSYFDYDLLNMRDQQSESVATFRDLVRDAENSPLHISVLAHNQQHARELQKQLSRLAVVKKVTSIYSLIPTKQLQRLAQLKILSQSLMNPASIKPKKIAQKNQHSTLSELKHSLLTLDKNQFPQLYGNLSRLIAKLNKQNKKLRQQTFLELDAALVGTFSRAMQTLQYSLNTNQITLQSLPADERRQWISPITQRFLLLVYPNQPLSQLTQLTQLREFVQQVKRVTSIVTDTPAISLAAGDVAVSAFTQALLSAIGLIALLLLFIYKSIRDTLLVLTPLFVAALLTTGLAVLLDIPFNFSNIIAIPLLFGIGVDNGIHIISRYRRTDAAAHQVLHSSTTRAVVLSAFTTIASFGNLAYSSHPGTASMGQLLSIGVLLTLLCTVLVLPILLVSLKPTSRDPAS